MHSFFKRLFGLPVAQDVDESAIAYARKLSELLIEQRRALDVLREDHETLKLKFESFQGRVYAWRRGGQPGIPPEQPAELPLSDPRVSKEELRARLLQPGKPFKHTN